MRPLELYIHIPFCISKCRYCDFLSAPSTVEERREYVTGLCRKIRSYGKLAEAYHVVSVFIGGGTPSILEPDQIAQIFEAVHNTFKLEKNVEITIEINPGTVDQVKLKTYRKVGINRLSIGLQSTNDKELKELGRIHTFAEFIQTYESARQEGFANINIDLISAIPYQSVESFGHTLKTTAGLCPEHISVYSLIIEEGTPFYERYQDGKHAEELPDEEEERLMYEHTRTILAGYGYHRYEISNYAKAGHECRHNLGYWDRTEYLGIGTGAASLIGNKRWTQGEKPQTLSIKEQMEEFMFLGLRKTEGVSRKKFRDEFGCSMESIYAEILEKMFQNKLMEENADMVKLTEKGINISNYVMSEFLL